MPRLVAGDAFPIAELTDTTQTTWPFPPQRLTHVQFRRFAGCPICNVHLIAVKSRIEEIEAAGIQELVVFNSYPEVLVAYAKDFPFPTIANGDGSLYEQLGITTSVLSSATVGAMGAAFRGMLRPMEMSLPRNVTSAIRLPADFLIDGNGTVVAAQYATHSAGQWSVDELLAHASAGAVA